MLLPKTETNQTKTTKKQMKLKMKRMVWYGMVWYASYNGNKIIKSIVEIKTKKFYTNIRVSYHTHEMYVHMYTY